MQVNKKFDYINKYTKCGLNALCYVSNDENKCPLEEE